MWTQPASMLQPSMQQDETLHSYTTKGYEHASKYAQMSPILNRCHISWESNLSKAEVINSCDDWQTALAILEKMHVMLLRRDAYGYSAAMRTAAPRLKLEHGLHNFGKWKMGHEIFRKKSRPVDPGWWRDDFLDMNWGSRTLADGLELAGIHESGRSWNYHSGLQCSTQRQ